MGDPPHVYAGVLPVRPQIAIDSASKEPRIFLDRLTRRAGALCGTGRTQSTAMSTDAARTILPLAISSSTPSSLSLSTQGTPAPASTAADGPVAAVSGAPTRTGVTGGDCNAALGTGCLASISMRGFTPLCSGSDRLWVNRASHHASWKPFRARAIGSSRPVERLSLDQPQQSSEVPASADSLQNVPRHNLPAELTSFVGRRKELTELRRLLTGSRLLSLTGDGGVGKTRLAVRLVSELVREAPEGMWLIDLAPLTTPALIAQTIATLIGVRESAGRSVREALVGVSAASRSAADPRYL